MSAKATDNHTVWDIQFAYQGPTARHWKTMQIVEGTEREANQTAEQLYTRPEESAVAFLVLPLPAVAEAEEGATL